MNAVSLGRALRWTSALLCVSVSVHAQAPAQTSAELNAFLQGLQTLQAEFRQTLRDGQGRMVEQSSGTLVIRRPNLFRWDYVEPNEQVIVADGKRLWLYDVDLEQVTVRPMETSLAGTPAVLLSGAEDIRVSFDVDSVDRQGTTSVVTLIPKRGDTDFKNVSIGFTRKELSFMQLNDKLGQSTLLEFSKVRRNAKVNDASFAFTPPAGVDVIGGEASAPERVP